MATDGDARSVVGVRVGHVVRGSPAFKAGILDGDRLARIDAVRVSGGLDVVHAVAVRAVGDVIDVGYVRSGQLRIAKVTLASFPSQEQIIRMDLVGTSAPTWRDVLPVSASFPSSTADLRGRVLLLDFWATWCEPCREMIPKLGALQARYGAQGLSVIGVSTEDPQRVALFAQRASIRYALAIDEHAETTTSYGVISLPTLVVIDKQGIVRDVTVGSDPTEEARIENTVRALLAEPNHAGTR